MKGKRLGKIVGAISAALILLWAATIVLAKPPSQGPADDEAPPPVEQSIEPSEETIGTLGNVSAAAAVEQRVSVQGRLTDSDGNAINGTQTITYALYENSSGGPPVCYDDDLVEFQDGFFNGLLDEVNGCTTSDINGRRLYLGLQVEGDSEMTPRQEIYPVPYAFSLIPGADIVGTINGASVLAVQNDSSNDSSSGVFGYASASTGATYGVYGRSDSANGEGVRGYNASGGPGVVARSVSGNPLEAYGVSTTDPVFRVLNSGIVLTDGWYGCGNSITGTVGGGAISEGDLEAGPCLIDDAPADFSEMLPATAGLEPGDVLVVGPDGKLAPSTTAYQPTVVGVYSTRPSYLGNSRYWDQEGYVPLAVVGVVPVKASTENGAIQPGDLLVASSTPGHAMKATPNPPTGTVVGKALGGLDKGTGIIQMLVILQ